MHGCVIILTHIHIQLRNSALFWAAKNSKSESSYCNPSIKIQLMLKRVLVNDSSFIPSLSTVPFSLAQSHPHTHSPFLFSPFLFLYFFVSLPLSLCVILPWICVPHSLTLAYRFWWCSSPVTVLRLQVHCRTKSEGSMAAHFITSGALIIF